jgi:hypothetical protein
MNDLDNSAQPSSEDRLTGLQLLARFNKRKRSR